MPSKGTHPHLGREVDLWRNEAPLRLGQRPGVAVPAKDGRGKRESIGNMIFLTPKSRVFLGSESCLSGGYDVSNF